MITQPDSIPDNLRRFEAKIDGPLWLDVIEALPRTLTEPLAASVKSSEPSNGAIKQHIANGGVVEGASVKRGYHLRIEESVAQSDSCRQHRPALALAYVRRIAHDSVSGG